MLREKCGVFGVFAPGEDVARLTFFGLHALQHRGQESAGIATADNGRIRLYAEMGLVTQIFDERALAGLPGSHAIGHTRYSTTGASKLQNAQPFIVRGVHGEIAIAHNGNVVNAELLRKEPLVLGSVSDTLMSKRQRASIVSVASVWAGPSVVPDGSIDGGDRRVIGWSYYGTTADWAVRFRAPLSVGTRPWFEARPARFPRMQIGWRPQPVSSATPPPPLA